MQRSTLICTCLAGLVAAAYLASPVGALAATTVIGTVKDATGTVLATGEIWFQLSQEGIVTDPAILITPPVKCDITAGVILAPGGGACSLRGNDEISPTGTVYRVRILSATGRQFMPERTYSITGATWDIGQQTPTPSSVQSGIHGASLHSGDVIPPANQEFGAFYSDFSEIPAPGNPASGTRRFFVDLATGELSVRTSAGTIVSLEAAASGAGDITSVGNCLTGACFQSESANQVFAAPDGAAGQAAFRALVDADLPATNALDAELHAQSHVLDGGDHTVSGLTIGNYIRALTATTFGFAAILDGDLPGSIARDSELHAQVHALVGADHTASGLTVGQVPRATGATTFAWQQLAFSDLTGSATDAQIPDTISIANLTQLGTRLHSDLQSIAVGDHHTAGAGLAFSGSVAATASQEAGFFADGGVTSLTCGVSNQGKGQVMDNGDLEFCDGATTSVLQKALTESDQNAGTDITTDLEEETHAAEHQHGGADEVATATAAANAIPKADSSADLAPAWIITGTITNNRCLRVNSSGQIAVDTGDCAAGGSGDSIEIEQGDDTGVFDPIDTSARFDDSGDINFIFTDGGAGGPDTVTATVRANSVALQVDTTGDYVGTVVAGTGIAVTGADAEDATKTVLFDFSDAGTDPALGAEECRFSNEGASAGGWVCEGLTANAFEMRFRVTDPTAERIVTFADVGGEVTLLGQTIEDGELASNYGGIGACGANQFETGDNDNAIPTCSQPSFSNLSGTATDGQVPDNITIATQDNNFSLLDDLDNTKVLVFQLSSITTATTRTVTVPDANGEMSLLGQTIATAELVNDAVDNTKLRNSAATSVIGRSAGTTGDPADIAASSDGQVLRRAAGALGFGALDLADTDAVTGLLPDANVAASISRDSESVASGDVSGSLSGGYTINTGAVASTELATANKQFTVTFVLESPVAADDALLQHKFSQAVTIQRISCSTDTGTATVQFDERAEATPNTAGTDVMTSTLVADSNTEATTTFSNATIAADVPLNLDIDAVASSPGVVRCHVDVQID